MLDFVIFLEIGLAFFCLHHHLQYLFLLPPRFPFIDQHNLKIEKRLTYALIIHAVIELGMSKYVLILMRFVTWYCAVHISSRSSLELRKMEAQGLF